VAESLIQVANGSTPAASGLDEAVELLRCVRCRAFYQGQAYALAGDSEQAIEAYEAYLADGFFDASLVETHILKPLIHERLGYLYAETGDTTRAAEHFLAFANQWSQADPDLQPRVARARELALEAGS
jgi:tetratricopeptide (TPR) repeat protein